MGVDTLLIIETGKPRFREAVCLPQSPIANAVRSQAPPCVFYHLIWPVSAQMLGLYQVQEDLKKTPPQVCSSGQLVIPGQKYE